MKNLLLFAGIFNAKQQFAASARLILRMPSPSGFVFTLFFCVLHSIGAQPKYNYNWYFGNNAAISFLTNPPSSKTDNQMKTYNGNSTVSDPETGELLFYTNGDAFWNRSGQLIDSAYFGNGSNEVLIIPLKAYKNRYLVVTFQRITMIDMEAKGGKGAVVKQEPAGFSSGTNRLCAVKHCLSESYWLITIANQAFNAYLIHPNGSIDLPVISPNTGMKTTSYLGDFVSSNDGSRLAYTCYSPVGSTYYPPQVFKFDKRCGQVENQVQTLPMEGEWDRPHGIAFSPDDRLLYVAYGFQKSQLVQYVVDQPTSYYTVALSEENFNQIACGPDGRLYITTHISGIPSNKIDVVANPNAPGAACNYKEDYLRLNGVTNFEVPNLVINHVGRCAENKGYYFDTSSGICVNEKAVFKLMGDRNGIDSVLWHFDDPIFIDPPVKAWETEHPYLKAGVFKPYAVIYFCNKSDTAFFELAVSPQYKNFLRNDTTLCRLDSLVLSAAPLQGNYLWNTGSTKPAIYTGEGHYTLEVNSKGCVSRDTVEIKYFPALRTLLGEAYYICEETQDLIRLDAGKGFATYLWTPNNDSTQWIEVDQRGAYYVVVSDFRGCKGKGETHIENRCDLRVFIPTAFTPNGDGLNDVFRIHLEHELNATIQIYNAWGELVFEGNQDEGWDGSYQNHLSAQGVYLVKLSVHGFLRMKKVAHNYQTLLHLLY